MSAASNPESPAWRRPPPEPSQLRADLGLGFAIFGLSILSLTLFHAMGLFPAAAGTPLSVLLLAGVTLPLIWRRRSPSATAIAVAVFFVVAGELAVPEITVINVALFMAIYSVGAWERNRRRADLVRLAIIAVMALWLLVSFFRASTADSPLDGPGVGALTPVAASMLQQIVVNVMYFAGAYLFGQHSWNAARERAISADRTRQLESERAKLARQAVTIERLRIARELHDAVAHHVSLMGVQAAAARTLLDVDPDRSRAQIEALEDSSRAAVAELYAILGTLRDDDAPDVAAMHGIAQLPALVDETTAAGVRGDYQVIGEPRDVSPLTSLALYRIAQESLTNVVKHAGPGSAVSVRLRYDDASVELEVADDGGGRPAAALARAGAGLGIEGMRERVAAIAGTLDAGRQSRGGFLVRAHVPLRPGAAAISAAESSGAGDGAGETDPSSAVGPDPGAEPDVTSEPDAHSTPARTAL